MSEESEARVVQLLRDPDTKAVLGWIRGRPLAGGGKEQTGRVRTLVYQAHLCEYMQTIIVKEVLPRPTTRRFLSPS